MVTVSLCLNIGSVAACAGTADVSIAPTIIMGTIFRFIAFTIPFDSKRADHFWPAQPAE